MFWEIHDFVLRLRFATLCIQVRLLVVVVSQCLDIKRNFGYVRFAS